MLLLSDATNGDLSNELYSDKKKSVIMQQRVENRKLLEQQKFHKRKATKSQEEKKKMELTQYIQKVEFRVYAASDATIQH